ncbi:hypothetical protein FRB94_010144 [Tulasnella sp. JGI-2019a]|nr:hypothetical protein FRB94_010144 [Tulasnella sp. JGI-2019a]
MASRAFSGLSRSVASSSRAHCAHLNGRSLRTMATEVASQQPTPKTILSNSPESISSALSFIRSQPSHYAIASLVGRKYLLTPRDLLTVPRLNDVKVGDTLALTDVHELGSREYTLRGDPVITLNGTVTVKATVVEHTKGRMEVIVKKKRRKGYKKTIKHKQTYTRLRIGDITVSDGSAEAAL